MLTFNLKETINTHIMCVEILRSVGLCIVEYFNDAKENNLVEDFDLNCWFGDDGCGLVIKPQHNETRRSIYEYPFGVSLYPRKESKVYCTMFFGAIKKEKEFDFKDECSLKIITMFAVLSDSLEEKLKT